MKKKHLCMPCLCAVFCIAIIFLAGAAKNPEIKTVEQLLQKRTVIMENVLLGKITYEEGKLRLREVEEGNLYRTDLNGILAGLDTDIESVAGMKVVFLEKRDRLGT